VVAASGIVTFSAKLIQKVFFSREIFIHKFKIASVITLNLYYTQHVCCSVNLENVMGKDKGHPRRGHEGPEGE
jgi:hypothetical protein